MASKLSFTITNSRFFTAPLPRPSVSASSTLSLSKLHMIQLIGRDVLSRRRLVIISPRATTDQPGEVKEDEVVDSNIMPYCSIENQKKKSLGEMEQDFLQALQSFYYEGKAIMSNEEFDNLKEELMWEGSSVVMLSSDEQKFLEAAMAYVSGNPIMSDAEYDKLKMQLKKDGSDIVVEGPRCSLRTRKVYSDLSVDYLKMFLINVPAAVVALGLPPLDHVDGVAPDKPLVLAVLTRLTQFSAMNKLKKMALKVIASKLSEEEIAGLKQMFQAIDTDNSGYLTFDELKAGLKRFGADLDESEIHDLMQAADIDNSGTIDYEEFVAATLHFTKVDREDRLFAAFSYFDKDGSGYITLDELQQACKEFGVDDIHLDEIIKEVDENNGSTNAPNGYKGGDLNTRR